MNSSHQRPFSPTNQQDLYYPAVNQHIQQSVQQDFAGSGQTTPLGHEASSMAFASPPPQHLHRIPMMAISPSFVPNMNYYHSPMAAAAECGGFQPQMHNSSVAGSLSSEFMSSQGVSANANAPLTHHGLGGPIQSHYDPNHVDPRLCPQGSPIHQGHVLYTFKSNSYSIVATLLIRYLQPNNVNNGGGQAPSGRFSTIAYHLKQPANHFMNSPSGTAVNPSGSYCCSQQHPTQQQTINGYIQHSNTQQMMSQSPLRVNCYNNATNLGARVVDPSNFEVIRMNHPCNDGDYCYSPHFDCSNLRRTPISPSAINSPFQQGLPDCSRLMQQQTLRSSFLQSSQESRPEGEICDRGLGTSINNQLSHHVSMQPVSVDMQSSRSTSTNAGIAGSFDTSVPVMMQPNRELSRYQRTKLKNPYGSSLDALTRVIEIDDSDPERKQFSDRMKQIWIQYSIKLRTLPTITKIPIDLFMLYKLVRERNGYVEVTMKKQWREVANILGIFHIQSAAFGVKRNYTKLGILRYECLYDLNGVDQDQILRDVEASKPPPSNRKRKRPSKTIVTLSAINCENTITSDHMNEDNTMDTPPSNSDSESPSASQMSAGLAINDDNQSSTVAGCASPCDPGFLFDKQWSPAVVDSLPHQSTLHLGIAVPTSIVPNTTAGSTLTNFEMPSGHHTANEEQTNQSQMLAGDNQSEDVRSKEGNQFANVVPSEHTVDSNPSSSACVQPYFLPEIPSGNIMTPKDQAAGATSETDGDLDHEIERKFSNPMAYINRVQSPGTNAHFLTSVVSRANTSSPRTAAQSPRAIYTPNLVDTTHQNFHNQRLTHQSLFCGYPRSVPHGQKMEGNVWNPNSFPIARPLAVGPLQSHLVPCQGNIQLLQTFGAYDRKRSKVATTSSAMPQSTLSEQYSTANMPLSTPIGIDNQLYHTSRLHVQDYGNINQIDPSAQAIYINAAGNRYVSTSPHAAYIIPQQNPVFVTTNVRPNGPRGFPMVQFDRHASSGKVLRGEQVCVNFKDQVRMPPPSVVHHIPPQMQCATETLAPSALDAGDPSLNTLQQNSTPSSTPSVTCSSENVQIVCKESKFEGFATNIIDPCYQIHKLRASMAMQQARRRSLKKKADDCNSCIRKIGLQLQTSLPCEVSNALGIINTTTSGCIEEAASSGECPETVDVTRYPTIICALAVIMTQALQKSCLHDFTCERSGRPVKCAVKTEADTEDTYCYDEESTLVCSDSSKTMSINTEYKLDLKNPRMDVNSQKDIDKLITVGSAHHSSLADDILVTDDEVSRCSFDVNELALSTSLAIRNLSFVQKNRHIMARSRLLCATLSEILHATFEITQNECNTPLSDETQRTDLKLTKTLHSQQYRMCVALRENILITLSNIAEALRLSIFADKARFCKTLLMLCQVREPMQTEPLVCVDMLAIEILTKLLTFSLDNREYLHDQCHNQLWANTLFDTLTEWLLASASPAVIDSKNRYGLVAHRESLLARADMSVSLLLFLLDGSISDGYSQQVKGHIRPNDSLTGFRLLWALLLHLRQELQTSRPGADKCALKCARAMLIIATHLRMVNDKIKVEHDEVHKREGFTGQERETAQPRNDHRQKGNVMHNVDDSVTDIAEVEPNFVQDSSPEDEHGVGMPDHPMGSVTEPIVSPDNSQSSFGGCDHENRDALTKSVPTENDEMFVSTLSSTLNKEHIAARSMEENGLSPQPNTKFCILTADTQPVNNELNCRIKLEKESGSSTPSARFGSRKELRLKSALVDTIFMVSCFGGDINSNNSNNTNPVSERRQILQSALSIRRRKGSINSTGTGMCISSTQQQIAARISSMLVHCLRKLDPNR